MKKLAKAEDSIVQDRDLHVFFAGEEQDICLKIKADEESWMAINLSPVGAGIIAKALSKYSKKGVKKAKKRIEKLKKKYENWYLMTHEREKIKTQIEIIKERIEFWDSELEDSK